MKVTEHIIQAKRPLISFEIIPPKRGSKLEDLLKVIDTLAKYNPPFIDVTSHAAEVEYEETPEGIRRRVKRKRLGVIGICTVLQHKYKIDAVPHLLCHGFTREETEDVLIEFHYSGIRNAFAVRGDENGYHKPLTEGKTANEYAVDLVTQITAMNRGKYLTSLLDAESTGFCIGVAGYPEKHYEAPNMTTDILHLKEKVDAGAQYIVTQMFFDNEHYFNFVEKCRSSGITVPIIPGLKVITSKEQLTRIPKRFHLEIPYNLTQEIEESPEHATEIGIAWTTAQVEKLIQNGVPSVHFYVMQNASAVEEVLKKVKY